MGSASFLSSGARYSTSPRQKRTLPLIGRRWGSPSFVPQLVEPVGAWNGRTHDTATEGTAAQFRYTR